MDLKRTQIDDMEFLGAGITEKSTMNSLKRKVSYLESIHTKIQSLPTQIAVYLLRLSFGLPRFTYLFRTSPCFATSEMDEISLCFKNLLTSLMNLNFTITVYEQACLPIKLGGLGFPVFSEVAVSAYLSSIFASEVICKRHLHNYSLVEFQATAYQFYATKLMNAGIPEKNQCQ